MLLPVYARDILGVGAAGLGLLTVGIGVGALTGALVRGDPSTIRREWPAALLGLSLRRSRRRLRRVALAAAIALALAVLGAAQVAYYATTNTLLQVLVPARLRGRVMSLYILTSLGVIPFGNLLAGLVAERLSATVALAGGGLLTLVAVGTVVVAYPRLRGSGPTPSSAATPETFSDPAVSKE